MKARLVFLLLCGIWGSTWLFIKLGLEEGLPPLSFAGIRFLLASAILWAVVAARGVRVPRERRDWALLAVTGTLFFTLNYGLVFWGEQHIPSGLAAVLQATIPAFGLVFAHLHLPGERLTAAKAFGVLLGVFGVGVIFSNQLQVSGRMALWGSVALVASAVFVAYSNVLVKARGTHLDPSVLAAGQMTFGLVPLLAVGFYYEGSPVTFRWTPLALVCLLYLTIVGSVVAFLLYYWLVQHMDVTKTMLIALVMPVTAVALGMIVRGERLTWRTLAGGACIMTGISLIVLRKTLKKEGRGTAEGAAGSATEQAAAGNVTVAD